MASFGHRKVLTVFLGSPGDVGLERQAARGVVDEVNESLREIGCQVELRGWEDTLPGCGRPQEIINADVRACHLFVGLVYARWGSKTGKYSSGFEEEFRIALDLKKQSGAPEIWLFFKRVPDELLKDPGRQLKRVLKFRGEVEAAREVLFRDIREGEWAPTLTQMLTRYVLRLFQQSQREDQETQPVAIATPARTLGQPTAAAPPDLVAAYDAAQGRLLDPTEVDPRGAVRLHLFTQTALFQQTRSPMGVHEINFLYRGRSAVNPGNAERGLIAVTVIGSAAPTTPGWFWLRPLDDDETRNVLLFVAGSAEAGARLRAAHLLADARIPLSVDTEGRSAEIDLLLADDDQDALVAKLGYLAVVGGPHDLSALDPLLADHRPPVRAAAAEAAALVAARADPAQLLAEVAAQRVGFVEALSETFLTFRDRLPTDLLEQVAVHPDPQLRAVAVPLLEGRGAVSPDLARRLTALEGDAIKAAGYRALLAAGELSCESVMSDAPSNQHLAPALIRSLGRRPFAELLGQIEWFGSAEKYAALARYHFAEFASRLRADLENRFESLWQTTAAKYQALGVPPADFREQCGPPSKLGRFVLGEYAAVAIRTLTEFGGQADLPVVRGYLRLHEFSARREAVRFVGRHGDPSDVGALIDLAREHWDVRHSAAVAAANRSPEVVRRLMTSGEVELVRVAVAALKPTDVATHRAGLHELLRHPTDGIRQIAVAGCCRLLTPADLEALLDEYAAASPYYYNVVCWLDRFLYAPSLLQTWYRQQLEQELSFPDPELDDPLWSEKQAVPNGA